MHFDGQSIDFYPQLIEKEMALVETYDSNYIKTFRGSSSDIRKQMKLSQLGTMYVKAWGHRSTVVIYKDEFVSLHL